MYKYIYIILPKPPKLVDTKPVCNEANFQFFLNISINAPQFYVKGHCKKENVPKMTQKLQYPKKWPNSIFEVQFCFLWWLYGSFRVCFVLNMVLEFWVWHWICYLKYPQNVCISQFFYMSGIDYTLCYGHHTLRTQRFEEHTINVPQSIDIVLDNQSIINY